MNNRRAGMVVVLLTVGTILFSNEARAAGKGWLTSLEQAQVQSRESGKPILANFTGSDWCGWCIKLKKEVFTRPEFTKWVSQNVILLEVDFPHRKVQSQQLKAKNRALAKSYGVRGYPTILFLDADGREIGRSGYIRGGAKVWIQNAQKIIGNPPKPEELKLAASLAEGAKQSQSTGKPLFLLVSYPGRPALRKATDSALEDPDFIKLANRRLIIVNLKLQPEKYSGDEKVLGELKERFKLPDAPSFMALLNLRDDTATVYKPSALLKPGLMTRAVGRALPPIEYDGGWIEDFELAQMIAADHNRPMLLDFTGSDWCGWCIKLHTEVFSTEEFREYAAKKLVLVKLDFPKKKKLTPQQERQNNSLARKFGVEGFPTLIILSPNGKKRGRMGYQPGGPGPFLQQLNRLSRAKRIR